MTVSEALIAYIKTRNAADGTWSTERARDAAARVLAEAMVQERYGHQLRADDERTK